MAVIDLYSKRRRRELGEVPDLVSYDPLPPEFRTQLAYLIEDALGDMSSYRAIQDVTDCYNSLVHVLRREYGVRTLSGQLDSYVDLHEFLREETNTDRVLDAVELAFRLANNLGFRRGRGPEVRQATEELNIRFKEHGLGYQFENERIIRTDSRLLHEEAVRPALLVLSDPAFAGPEQEFLEAFEHHRHQREKDALTWGLKALESTLKVICGKRGWPDTGQAKDLLDTIFKNGLVEPLWQSEFSGLRSVLESGVPTARNKLGGHGQGAIPTTVPAYLAAFVLHQTAAAILFLVEAHKAKS